MKDYPYMLCWRLNKENNKPAIKHSILMLTTHGVAEGEWDGNEWIQYRWSCKLKDSDVLYWIHLGDLTRLEKEGDSLQQEQTEVDLEKEIERVIRTTFFDLQGIAIVGTSAYATVDDMEYIARHFYELGKARKEE